MTLRRHVWCLAAAALLAAVCFPLVTYTLTLATFGAAHVLAELRYVDTRFGARFSARAWWGIGALLAAVAAVRLGVTLFGLGVATARVVELGAAVGLALAVVPSGSRRTRATAVMVALALALGIAISPVSALLAIAVLHNLTPLAFLYEARPEAPRGLWRSSVVLYVVLPLLVVTGLPYALLSALGLTHLEAWIVFPGPLEHHMRAYIPQPLLRESFALHVFSACAFLQCMHYLFVIDVLPRRFAPAERVPLRWPHRFAHVLVAAVVVSLVSFVALGFAEAKAGYAAMAAVHAWLEVPVLILVVSASTAVPRQRTPHSRPVT